MPIDIQFDALAALVVIALSALPCTQLIGLGVFGMRLTGRIRDIYNAIAAS